MRFLVDECTGPSVAHSLRDEGHVRWAEPDARVAFVTPTSFLPGQYFRNLRKLLAVQAPPQRFELISVRGGVFDDVLQEALLAVYRRGKESRSGCARHLELKPFGEIEVEEVGPFTIPSHPAKPWIVPRQSGQASLVRAAQRQSTRLADLGYRVTPVPWPGPSQGAAPRCA